MNLTTKARFKNFIGLTCHPNGCKQNTIKYIRTINKKFINKKFIKKNILIIGSSQGYGFFTKLISIFGYKYNTIGIFLEKKPTKKKSNTPGWYHIKYLENEIKNNNIYYKNLNKDAFSTNTLNETIKIIKTNLKKIDILIYSLASSKYKDENLNLIYKSVLKPIKKILLTKSLNTEKKHINIIKINKATHTEIKNTKKIMGGQLWIKWISTLIKNKLINKNFKTIAYSYNGPKITQAIYKYGTIGIAKKHLCVSQKIINKKLKKYKGSAIISINEAIITQSSLAIPSLALYIAILNNIKKFKKYNLNDLSQIINLFQIINEKDTTIIKLNNIETRNDITNEIYYIWKIIKTKNINKFINIQSFKSSYFKLYGFGI